MSSLGKRRPSSCSALRSTCALARSPLPPQLAHSQTRSCSCPLHPLAHSRASPPARRPRTALFPRALRPSSVVATVCFPSCDAFVYRPSSVPSSCPTHTFATASRYFYLFFSLIIKRSVALNSCIGLGPTSRCTRRLRKAPFAPPQGDCAVYLVCNDLQLPTRQAAGRLCAGSRFGHSRQRRI